MFGSKVFNAVKETVGSVGKIIDDLHTSKEEKGKLKNKLTEIQNELTEKMIKLHMKELDTRKEVLKAEMNGNWLQRSWRPILMLSIVTIIVNNYLVYPYLSMFTEKAIVLELPKELWQLMKIGVGGYIAGRSGEKIVREYKKPKK
jgi:uncharacterized membrane protein (DUF106 family)